MVTYLESAIDRIKNIEQYLYFDIDKHRVRQLQHIFDASLDLCKQSSFEEQERLCFQIEGRCQDLLQEINLSPTRFSVDSLIKITETIQTRSKQRLEELYEISTPQITIKLPIESYIPDANQQIEIQILVSNRLGCSPAESLELIFPQQEEEAFSLLKTEIKLDGSLRGGDQKIFTIPLQVTEQAILAQAFSLPVYAQFQTRSREITQTLISNFSIRLYSEKEFDEIDNPYASYAEGGVVSNPEMFYGRQELIDNVTLSILKSRREGKCVVIFGQKRAGKSSILYHLKINLLRNENILVLDVGNIGSLLDQESSVPMLYRILWGILAKLKYAIDDRVATGVEPIEVKVPSDIEFYAHPSPLQLFKTVFEDFYHITAKKDDWKNVYLILLIDEFSYIYDEIVRGRISDQFMKNWKALLQENFFSAILAGQDVMPKFKNRFPNEFGTTQDERVTYFRREDAVRLIEDPVRIGGVYGDSRYREKAVDRIIDLTAGSPFYIQIICNRLVEYMNRKKARLITDADVEQLEEELIKGINALGKDKFDNLLSSGDTSPDAISLEDAYVVLKTIATNSKTGSCSRHSIICETKASLDDILEDLVSRDVLERRDQYYRIRVGLFKDWLVAHQ